MSLFTKKDLGLLLPDTVPGDPESLRHTKTRDKTDQFEPLKPKVDPSKKITRYRAGQAPKWSEEAHCDDEGFVGKKKHEPNVSTSLRAPSKPTRQKFKAEILSTVNIPSKHSSFHDREEPIKKGFQRHTESSDESNPSDKNLGADGESSEDDEEIDSRRQLLKAKLLQRKQVEEENKEEIDELTETREEIMEQEEEDEESSEWETDTDESEEEKQKMLKPVFVPRHARQTILEKEEMLKKEKEKLAAIEEKMAFRQDESKKMVAEVLLKEKNEKEAADNTTDGEMPDDTDGLDPEDEYKEWELRELRRIKRDQDERNEYRKELEETERRRNMTEEELIAENEQIGKSREKDKQKIKFLQKYYHKGVFYMDESSVQTVNDVRNRDYTDATLEDKFNKEMMPAVMQVKNFGRSGRTKYTHLADQDTTSRDSFWSKSDEIREKYFKKVGGVGNIDTAGRKHPKRQKTNE